jgi:hypothetical protein
VFDVQTRTVTIALCFWTLSLPASDFETIGLATLRTLVPSLTGAGVVVAQPEAGAPAWQVNPAAISQPPELFTWHSSGGSETNYPNSLGNESWHANEVAKAFFGLTNGAAPGIAHADTYDANYFFNSLVKNGAVIPAKVVNQSFIFTTEMPDMDADYDNYVAQHGTIFLNGAGNGGAVSSPGSAYNVIAVGAYGGSSSTGPTLNSRAKPDITAPASLTSFSTPLVAGTATLLLQAASRGDGGPGTSTAASNVRTIKALLLNGATKPADWTNVPGKPLDLRYGAGVLHAWNSYRQLRGGRHTPVVTQTISLGGAHPPASNTNNLPTRRGWDFSSISHAITQDAVNHYFFDLSRAPGRTFTTTLTWIRQENQVGINNLDLFLYDATTGNPVASSESIVDNVEHLRVPALPAGRYNLQVLKRGGLGMISASETYALAFEFGPSGAPALANQQVLGGQLLATVVGEPNQNYAVQFSSAIGSWNTAATNKTGASGTFQFTNAVPSATNRFYRVVELP